MHARGLERGWSSRGNFLDLRNLPQSGELGHPGLMVQDEFAALPVFGCQQYLERLRLMVELVEEQI